MNRPEALEAFRRTRVGHLATTRPGGGPHVVPVTFAVAGEAVVTMIDHKPKSARRLQRLVNIDHDPRASVLTDHYTEDWSGLWWVRIDGAASIHEDGPLWSGARDALVSKYSQYADRPPQGPAIVVSIDRVTSWEGTP